MSMAPLPSRRLPRHADASDQHRYTLLMYSSFMQSFNYIYKYIQAVNAISGYI